MFPTSLRVVWLMYIVTICMAAVESDVMMDMVQKQNIPIKKHTVITSDGYILGLYNIPPKYKQNNNETKIILLLPGLSCVSSQYVMFPNDSAGYFFHDHDYDVWFGNFRGNTFSRNHSNLDPEKSEFWNFSFHEMGTFDMPAFVDHILEYTKKDELILYGHSLGSTIMLVFLCERPEYNVKVSSIHLLAATGINSKSFVNSLEFLAPNSNQFAIIAAKKNIYEIFSHKSYAKMMNALGQYCATFTFSYVCKRFLEAQFGRFTNGFSRNLVSDVAASGWPGGSSLRTYVHISQCVAYGSFQKYDFGLIENLKLYSTERPPAYKLSNIRTNVHLMYAIYDILALDSDARYLIQNLKNAKQIRRDNPKINHCELILRPYVKGVNEIVEETIKQFEN